MRATIPYIEKKFEVFNRQMFGGNLPPIPVELSRARTFLGQCVYKRKRNIWGKVENYDFRLRISIHDDLPENLLEDTIIHEMIHYYIGVNKLKDTSTHGRLFRQMMDDINKQYGRHISISHKRASNDDKPENVRATPYHVIAVVTFKDGRKGFKVIPRIVQRITKYYNVCMENKDIENVELFIHNHPYFHQFPNSATLKVHFVDEDFTQYLTDAERLTCDGRSAFLQSVNVGFLRFFNLKNACIRYKNASTFLNVEAPERNLKNQIKFYKSNCLT